MMALVVAGQYSSKYLSKNLRVVYYFSAVCHGGMGVSETKTSAMVSHVLFLNRDPHL